MPGTTSRKAFTDFLEAAQEDICIIPSDIFSDLLKGQQQRDGDLFGVLNRIATALETMEEHRYRHFLSLELKMNKLILSQSNTSTLETLILDIGEKISGLTEAIAQSSKTMNENIHTGEKDKEAMQKNISKLKNLRGQYLSAERTSEFIEEGLARSPPYVDRKFRVEMNKDTPADEIDLYKSEAMDKAKREVSLLKIRLTRWEKEISTLRADITTELSRQNASVRDRMNIEQQIKKDEELNLERREDTIQMIKDHFEADMRSGAAQFLIKYTEDAESRNEIGNADWTKHFSHRYRKRGYRRIDWRGRWNFW